MFIPFLIFISVIVLLTYKTNKRVLKWHFSNKVESIKYSIQKTPTVKLKGNVSYSLAYFYVKESDSILIGDSLVKKLNDRTLYHYRLNKNNKYYLYNKHKMINHEN